MKPHVLLLLSLLLTPSPAIMARDRQNTIVMRRVFTYAATINDSLPENAMPLTYVSYTLRINKRNPILLAVPTMYTIARGKQRTYEGESIGKVVMADGHPAEIKELFHRNNIPHRRRALTTLNKYLIPDIYAATIAGDILLSPFNKANRHLYSYRSVTRPDGNVEITFKPRIENTQLVSGTAIADFLTGRIISTEIQGEYDMIRFNLHLEMGAQGAASLFPVSCELDALFRFLGNNISTDYHASVADTLANDSARTLFHAFEQSISAPDSTHKKTKHPVWLTVGEHLVNRTKTHFGSHNQGYLRISPLLNPLYLGYSKHKGVHYKFEVKSSFIFNENQEFCTRLKAGYSFKQRQFYFRLPTFFHFNKRHGGYIEAEVGNGNRITNSDIVEQVKHERADSINWEHLSLDYFKDTYIKTFVHYDWSAKIGAKAGLIVHYRDAVDKKGFKLAGKPHAYRSAAPALSFEYRPTGYSGPILTIDYERSIKGLFKSNTGFERWEADAQYLHRMPALRSLSMRIGTGFYTHKETGAYFLDYTNFRDENIPGGWNDEWTGSFELLDRNWYNASEYYVRSNLTYESPLLFVSWIPLAGRYVETERIYFSALTVRHLHPYIECGYGLQTHLFSIGFFLANRNGKFDGCGARFGFQLFRQW
ncbi:MAG: hypothetical protein IJM81_02180 [Prevotella sp.]|nr:hypothetical protein [Prevotella sp.]